MELVPLISAAALANLQLQPVGTHSRDTADRPSVMVYHVTGTEPEDWIHIERLGVEQFLWCVVWYCLVDGQWRRTVVVDGLFQTAVAALESVALALQNQFAGDTTDLLHGADQDARAVLQQAANEPRDY